MLVYILTDRVMVAQFRTTNRGFFLYLSELCDRLVGLIVKH